MFGGLIGKKAPLSSYNPNANNTSKKNAQVAGKTSNADKTTSCEETSGPR